MCSPRFVFSHLSSPPCCSRRERRTDRQEEKQLLQNKTTKLPEDHTATTTQQELPFAQAKILSQPCLSASASALAPLLSLRLSLCRLLLRRDLFDLKQRRCCFGSCVVSRRRRRQQTKQERKLDFRETKEKHDSVFLCYCLFISSLKVCQQTVSRRDG